MEILTLIGGAVGGILIGLIIEKHSKICGVIDVDHRTEMCKVRITSADLSNRKSKTAVFKINHDAIISREEQTL